MTNGNVLEGEATGEICIHPKSPYAMFDGYFDNPEATLEAFRGLWFHTGDFGQRLPSGAFAFVDRKKDCLRRLRPLSAFASSTQPEIFR